MIVLHLSHQRFLNRFSYQITKKKNKYPDYAILLGLLFLQEKSKKILDIWTKANTFPTAVLSRLKDLVKDAEKGAYHKSYMSSLSIPLCSSNSSLFYLCFRMN